jgi:hypothetical protein
MKKENEERLYNRYPSLYRQHSWPMCKTCMCWGFAHGDGWYKIIAKLSKKLNELSANHPGPAIEVIQVKEKFGTLRVYTNYDGDPVVSKVVEEAERASAITCEVCGSIYRVKLETKGWHKVRCEKCRKKEKKA